MQARCHDPGGEPYVASCREAAEFFDILAATARLRILATLARASDAVCSCVFVDGLGLAASTVSHHLERLIAHGFVVAERRGLVIMGLCKPCQ